MRILLVQPDCEYSGLGFRLAAMPEPLALEMLAACVPDHECRILDLRVEPDLTAALERFAPDMVAVTALTPEVYCAQEVVRAAKRFDPGIFTLVGGHHASLLPEDFFLPEVDAVAVGEGEAVFAPVVQAASAGRRPRHIPGVIWRDRDGSFRRNPAPLRPLNMDALPLPRRDLTQRYRREYFFLFDRPDTSVATSRGCPYHCNFCSVWVFYRGRVRQMSPPRVLAEVKAVTTDHMTFVDDNFLMNARREGQIADMIRAEGIRRRFSMECRTDSICRRPDLLAKWVDVGLYAVLLGLEGASDRTLQSVNKRNTLRNNDEAIRILRDHGVIIWGAFLVEPDWQADDFKRLRDYVTRMEITHTQFTVLTPLPGTDLFRQKLDQLLTFDYSCYDALHAVVPTRLPREEFYRHFASLYRQTDIGPYFDLVRQGKMTVEDCKRGKRMLDAMSRPELYLAKDPVLGACRPRDQIPPGVRRLAACPARAAGA